MIEEYHSRFQKIHKCAAVLQKIVDLYDASKFPTSEPTPLRMAMPDEYRSENIVESYRRFYASKPRVRYPKNKIPQWFRKFRGDIEFQIV